MRPTWTDDRLDDFRAHVDSRFDAVDQKFEAVDQRFEAVDQRFEAVDQRFGEVNRQFGEVNKRLDHLVSQGDRHTDRIDALHHLIAHFATAVIAILGTTIAALLGLLFTQS